MGWTNVEGFPHLLFPASARWVLAADLVGLVAMVVRRNRVALFIAVMGGFSAAVVCLDPQGKLYNVRFLPLWFLCLYLMAGYALAETVSAVGPVEPPPPPRPVGRGSSASGWTGPTACRGGRGPGSAGSVGRPPTGTHRARWSARSSPWPRPAWPWCRPWSFRPPTSARWASPSGANQPSAWAEWNYSGYERKPDYPEYRAVIQMMAKVGADQGCGRAMWEYDPSLNRFGTTMSLMLLPYWTNGCVDSMEGLLFESSSTTPFHFINQNELSVNPSDAVNSVGFPTAD